MSKRYDFVIVGGGIVGACLAEELALAGAGVLVLDAGPAPGHASVRAAGVTVPSLRYHDDPDFSDWLARAGTSLRADIARLTPGHGPFSLALPILRLLREADLGALTRATLRGHDLGKILQPDETAALLPGAAPRPGTVAARGEGLMVSGADYLRAVQASAIRHGVRWRQDSEVTWYEEQPAGHGVTVRCADGHAAAGDRVVLAAGAWTGQLTGNRVPISPQRGQLVVITPPEPVRLIVSSHFYLAPLPAGPVVVGATEEDAGFDLSCTAGAVARLLAFAIRTRPDLSDAAVLETRAGLRPVSGTGRPLIGRLPWTRRVYVAGGHAGHGLLTARLTAQGTAAGLVGKDWDGIPAAFCPAEEQACTSTT